VSDERPRARRSPEREAAIRAALAEMRVEYRRMAPAQLAEIAGCIAQARRGEAAAEALAQARLLAHRIHGTAGSCGWKSVSDAAGRIEDTLVDAAGAPSEEALRVIEAALAEATAALEAGDADAG
jgi:HPt (histidine-containing phosphotransfer) domain-containing protein